MNHRRARVLSRTANMVVSRYRALQEKTDFATSTNKIKDSSERLNRICRKHRLTQLRNWGAAEKLVKDDYRKCLNLLRKQIDEALQDASKPLDHAVEAAEVYRDLVAIEQEFDGFKFDLKGKTLSVESKGIRLGDVELGRFKIELHVDSISNNDKASYNVIALECNPPDSDESVTHPHVDSDRLCEGDAQPAIRLALQQGRLLDFFQIVEQVLGNYNPSSAYVKIEDWNGITCGHCGFSTSSEECRDCTDCGARVCDGCVYTCTDCDDPFCGNCENICGDCSDAVCKSCVRHCDHCGEEFCTDCLTQNRRCLPCEEKEKEEAQARNTETEVHADGVGEVAVST